MRYYVGFMAGMYGAALMFTVLKTLFAKLPSVYAAPIGAVAGGLVLVFMYYVPKKLLDKVVR